MAQTLLDHGWKDVHPLEGGFDAWRDAGGAMESKGGRAAEERPEAR